MDSFVQLSADLWLLPFAAFAEFTIITYVKTNKQLY